MLGSATAAEECGFDSIWVFDHVVLQKEQGSRYPYAADGRLAIPPTVDFLEPLTSLSGRDPEQLRLAINRVAALSESDAGIAAKTLDYVRELGVDHAVVQVAPGVSDSRKVLEAFANRHLAEFQER